MEKDLETKIYSDQLLRLLSNNMIFLHKIINAQWNYNLFDKEKYNSIVNLLFVCGESIACLLKEIKGHVPATLDVYIALSDIRESLTSKTEVTAIKELVSAHASLLHYLKEFQEDTEFKNQDSKTNLIEKLLTSHNVIFSQIQTLK